MSRFCVVNLGCKVNRVESDGFERVLRQAGHTPAAQDRADVVIVNTCTVTGEAEKKTRKAVRHALKINKCGDIVVTGCASALSPDLFESFGDRVRVVGKAQMESYLAATYPACEVCLGDRSQIEDDVARIAHVDMSDDALLFSSRTRVGVKVQDGCDNACTYCIVHVARGKATSRPHDEILSEVVSLSEAGVLEIVLSGINIGSYSYGDTDLAALLVDLLEATKHIHAQGEQPVRFRVSSIEPMDVTDAFVELLASSGGRVCRHLHLPLQSGSTKVLREMARPYDAEDFRRLVDFLYASVPELSLTTDIIVGFPGETDDDFADTCAAARDCRFTKIHVFPYSLREGTPAAQRKDQVPPELKAARAAQLRALSDELRAQGLAAREGTTEFALVEESGRAMTESYFEVAAPTNAAPGSLVSVVLGLAPASSNADALQ